MINIQYYTETLIPDLKESGYEATAEDMQSLVDELSQAHKTIAKLVRHLEEARAEQEAAYEAGLVDAALNA